MRQIFELTSTAVRTLADFGLEPKSATAGFDRWRFYFQLLAHYVRIGACRQDSPDVLQDLKAEE